MRDLINHPAVTSVVCTCLACPEQYQGTLADGRAFYFRYRSGRAVLGIGEDVGAAIAAAGEAGDDSAESALGDPMQGIFCSADQRDRVFAQLYAEITVQRKERCAAVDQMEEHQ